MTARSFSTRLVVAFAGVALTTLLVGGVVVLGFSRARAEAAAKRDLTAQAAALAPLLDDVRVDRVRRLLPVLRLQEATVVRFGPGGDLSPPPPAGLDASDLDPDRLAAGEVVRGRKGAVVFVAWPLSPEAPPGGRTGRARALVLTRDVGGFDLRGLGAPLTVGAVVALGAALVAGTLVARRLAQPLAATRDAARAIAAGDLSARVGPRLPASGPDRELAEVAHAFDEMADELERSRSLSRDFLMSVSHDLRTPLTSIRGYAEALAEGTVRDQAGRVRAAGVIEAEARRLERLVADLLDLARLDARQFTLRPRSTDPAEVVRATVAGLDPLASEFGVALNVAAPSPGERMLDPERLGQVVANLVENALKFATSNVSVTLMAGAGGALALEVSDDGPGIPSDDLPRVFDRLFTTRPGERNVGTGLGLAIVAELVEAMSGIVEVESAEGRGATFRVRLP
ncbi:MAG: HAMP domain-containing histidine kinase [Actinobacteria bacterium]|nr:HAMP domain-containing histidine kinase [Actinomycetota bacterium]